MISCLPWPASCCLLLLHLPFHCLPLERKMQRKQPCKKPAGQSGLLFLPQSSYTTAKLHRSLIPWRAGIAPMGEWLRRWSLKSFNSAECREPATKLGSTAPCPGARFCQESFAPMIPLPMRHTLLVCPYCRQEH